MFGNFLNLKNKLTLAKVLRSLDESLPRKIEISKFGEFYKCYAYDSEKIAGSMSPSVHAGSSKVKEIAILKALSEYYERKAVYASDFKYTNGAAAQPVLFSRSKALKIAKKRSFMDALERYAFYRWFDNYNIQHQMIAQKSITLAELSNKLGAFRSGCFRISLEDDAHLIVSFLDLKNGVIFGLACDSSRLLAFERSLSELIENAMCFKAMNRNNINEQESEILNLAYNGKKFLRRVYDTLGREPVPKARIIKSEELKYEFSKEIAVYRTIIEKRIYSKSQLSGS